MGRAGQGLSQNVPGSDMSTQEKSDLQGPLKENQSSKTGGAWGWAGFYCATGVLGSIQLLARKVNVVFKNLYKQFNFPFAGLATI